MELKKNIWELVKPIADMQVNLWSYFKTLFIFVQFSLDYINSSMDPPLEDLKIPVNKFLGLRGTHVLARQIVKLLVKSTEPDSKLWFFVVNDSTSPLYFMI